MAPPNLGAPNYRLFPIAKERLHDSDPSRVRLVPLFIIASNEPWGRRFSATKLPKYFFVVMPHEFGKS